MRSFGEFCQKFAVNDTALAIFIGLKDLQLRAGSLTIDWVGTRAERTGTFFRRGSSEGNSTKFDTIVITTGFGLERTHPNYSTPSYWRNEQLAQTSCRLEAKLPGRGYPNRREGS